MSEDIRPFVQVQQTLAERQLANARRDPRLDRGPEAMVADWWAAIEAAERTRNLSIIAINQLACTHTEPGSDSESEQLWERSELARADVANDFAELNALILVSLISALDAMVESLAPQAQQMTAAVATAQAIERVRVHEPEIYGSVSEELIEDAKRTLEEILLKAQGKPKTIGGLGAKRWEVTLTAAGLGAPKDRPLPADLDEALAELLALRQVIVHRGGRVDERAAPSLEQEEGELVRIGGDEYRRYSAAILTYGEEIIYRLLRGVGAGPPDLKGWSQNYTISA